MTEFLLIGELASPTLVADIDAFSSELRIAAQAVKATPADRIQPNKGPRNDKVKTGPLETLGRYFEEYSGRRRVGQRRAIIADCYHGAIVRALRDALTGFAEIRKTQEIDLIALTDTKAIIFEVKTSSDKQSIYTAVGQLSVHAPVITKHIHDLPLEKVIVLPGQPADPLRKTLTDDLGLRILTFSRSVEGHVTINGLNELM